MCSDPPDTNQGRPDESWAENRPAGPTGGGTRQGHPGHRACPGGQWRTGYACTWYPGSDGDTEAARVLCGTRKTNGLPGRGSRVTALHLYRRPSKRKKQKRKNTHREASGSNPACRHALLHRLCSESTITAGLGRHRGRATGLHVRSLASHERRCHLEQEGCRRTSCNSGPEGA